MNNWKDKYEARRIIEDTYEWMKWTQEIPYINLPDTYSFKVIPPFGGAVARFCAARKENANKSVSVYLDCYSELGIFSEPYWEIYPYTNGDIYRCAMNEIEELEKAIIESIEQQYK